MSEEGAVRLRRHWSGFTWKRSRHADEEMKRLHAKSDCLPVMLRLATSVLGRSRQLSLPSLRRRLPAAAPSQQPRNSVRSTYTRRESSDITAYLARYQSHLLERCNRWRLFEDRCVNPRPLPRPVSLVVCPRYELSAALYQSSMPLNVHDLVAPHISDVHGESASESAVIAQCDVSTTSRRPYDQKA